MKKTKQLTDKELRAAIQKFNSKAESTTDKVAKEVFIECALACEVALAERIEDRAVGPKKCIACGLDSDPHPMKTDQLCSLCR